jgi:urea transport system substrate-binding protein
VYETTKREQLPELSLSFIGEFYLRGRLEIAVPVVPRTQPTPDPCAAASDHWRAADAIGSVAAFEDHLARFPNCTFAGLAKARIESLKEKLAVVAPPATPVAPPFVAPRPVVPPSARANGQDTIKVGILHSLSGAMAISETTLKDVMLMLIDEQNKKGGVLGKKLEAVVVDPASNWPLFAEKARELISKDKVAVVFGGWTSISRKSVLPVFKELDSILFYPVQYEGEESERNVFYTGAAPNQQAIPAVDYMMSEEKVKRWVLAGTDYVYPRTTNKILEAYLKQKGVKDEDIMINYTPFGHSDWRTIVAAIKKFGSQGKKTAVVSTINGDANVPFYRELGNQGVKATAIPVLALSISEEELAGTDTKPLVGHLAAWNYFESIKNTGNEEFIAKWKAFTQNPRRVTNDPMEAHYIGFNMWVKAVETAKTTDPDTVIDALPGIEAANLSGGISKMLPEPPHHQAGVRRRGACGRPVRCGVEDPRPRPRRRLVELPAGLEGPGSRLGHAQMRQLQQGHQEVRRCSLRAIIMQSGRGWPPSAAVRPPLVKLGAAEIERIRLALAEAGLIDRRASRAA